MNKVMAGIDLHSNNLVVGIMDQEGKRVGEKKLPCELQEVVKVLVPFKKRLEQVAVESTYNWYWLVDGLRALGYPVVLANPAAMQQYSGIKSAGDTNDAFFLAEQSRLKILPTGYIYDPELRPVRDLLRRRVLLVHQRTALMLSFKSLYTRTTGQEIDVAPVTASASPVVTGADLRDLGAAVAVMLLETLGGGVSVEGETLTVRLPG